MCGLLTIDKAPPHARNVHILTGYRPLLHPRQPLGLAALDGLLSIHNQSLNVWTHLVGSGWFAARALRLCTEPLTATRSSCLVFHIAATFCLLFSATYHLLGPVSRASRAELLYALDMSGICLQIGGSYVPGLVYAFRCMPVTRAAYTLAAGTMVGLCFVFCNAPRFRGPPGEHLRVSALGCTAAFGLIPLCHWLVAASNEADRALMLGPSLLMFACYGVGFVFWKSRLPESALPGRFDLALASHSWWHALVLAAALTWDEACHRMLSGELDPGRACVESAS